MCKSIIAQNFMVEMCFVFLLSNFFDLNEIASTGWIYERLWTVFATNKISTMVEFTNISNTIFLENIKFLSYFCLVLGNSKFVNCNIP
jgi:hypothetical protein